MELLQLYYFQTVARCQHISAAARQLHIAQPALSQTIRRLETELGTPLFDRAGRHICLNRYGQIFLKYTDTVLNALADARAEIAEAQASACRQVTLCVLAASSLLPDILGKFTAHYPQIRFQIIQSANATAPMPEIDLTIHAAARETVITEKSPKTSPGSAAANAPEASRSASCILLEEPMVIALPARHPLAARKSLALGELSGQPFASLHQNSNLFQITRYYCHQAGFDPQISLSCDNPQAFRELLSLNLGIAMIPAISWPDMSAYGIVTRPISDISCRRCLLLSWDPGRYLNQSAVQLRDFLKDYFARLAKNAPLSPQPSGTGQDQGNGYQ